MSIELRACAMVGEQRGVLRMAVVSMRTSRAVLGGRPVVAMPRRESSRAMGSSAADGASEGALLRARRSRWRVMRCGPR
jgi:hypothetical protein